MSVSPELHNKVIARDGLCYLARSDVPGGLSHVCRDRWGQPHEPTALDKLTVDHVWLISGGVRGKRAPDTEATMVAMCYEGNVRGPSRLVRQSQRDYLRRLYPDAA
jgi:hypothetical protein